MAVVDAALEPSAATVTPSVPQPTNAASKPKQLKILHFNDVYEVDARSREPVGGISRFTSLLRSHEAEDPCVLFSGDFLAPSMLSTQTHGMHMVPFFNRMNIKAAVLGNRMPHTAPKWLVALT